MAKKAKKDMSYTDPIPTPTETPIPTPTPKEIHRVLENETTLRQETIKPHVDDYVIERIHHFSKQGWDHNRIAATLSIHKHIVEQILS